MTYGITIVGLGSGEPEQWTQDASARLSQTDEIYLRTANHPSFAHLVSTLHNFDNLLEQYNDVEQVDQKIAEAIVRLGQRAQGVIYAVPGHPALDEPAFSQIRTLAKAEEIPLTIVPGLSLLEAARSALDLNGPQPLQIVQAAEVAKLHHPPLSPDQAALVTHCYPHLAAKLKKTLLNAYAGHVELTLIKAAGSAAEKQWRCRLVELDHQSQLDAWTMLHLPADTANTSFVTFQDIIAHLRGPDGCPWDREQTHQSLRPFLLEETYEVLEALDNKDATALAEELGDLLLQIVLHTQVAIDQGDFKMGQVIGHISRKMLRRHPHVFGDVSVEGSDEVITNWEIIKKTEKQAKGQRKPSNSALDGLPPALPALAQTLAICQRVVRIGFEWPTIEGLLEKLVEEAREIAEASDPQHLAAEIGDFLFNAVNLSRWYDVDPESALRATNARFSRRFRRVEALAAEQGQALTEMSLDEMQRLWRTAKHLEG